MSDSQSSADGHIRTFAHSDDTVTDGLAIVTGLLDLPVPPPLAAIQYRLSFHRDASSLVDETAVSLQISPRGFDEIATRLGVCPADSMNHDGRSADTFRTLVQSGSSLDLPTAAREFIDEKRADFQAPVESMDSLRFARASGVDQWTALWYADGRLHLRAQTKD